MLKAGGFSIGAEGFRCLEVRHGAPGTDLSSFYTPGWKVDMNFIVAR